MVRPWLVIPVLGVASGGVALAGHHAPLSACAIALLGAALAAAIRAFNGPAVAAAVSAGAGAALGVLGLLALGAASVRPTIGGAAAMFAICELARPKPPNASPLPAVGAAILAGVLDPAYVALVPVASIYLVVAPWAHRRWMIALPIAGVLATGIVIVAAVAHAGHLDPAHQLARTGELLGPLAACAAVAGFVVCATRGTFAAASVYAVIVLALLVTVCDAAVAPAVPIVAGLGAGIAIGRLAAMIRLPMGQTFLGATAGFVLVVVPAWSLVASL